MSRWDIFRWSDPRRGGGCLRAARGGRDFRTERPCPPRPQRVPPFGISDGGGDTGLCGPLAGCSLSHGCRQPAPPKGECLGLPLWGRCPVGGGEGSGKPPSWCVTVRETLRCFP